MVDNSGKKVESELDKVNKQAAEVKQQPTQVNQQPTEVSQQSTEVNQQQTQLSKKEKRKEIKNICFEVLKFDSTYYKLNNEIYDELLTSIGRYIWNINFVLLGRKLPCFEFDNNEELFEFVNQTGICDNNNKIKEYLSKERINKSWCDSINYLIINQMIYINWEKINEYMNKNKLGLNMVIMNHWIKCCLLISKFGKKNNKYFKFGINLCFLLLFFRIGRKSINTNVELGRSCWKK